MPYKIWEKCSIELIGKLDTLVAENGIYNTLMNWLFLLHDVIIKASIIYEHLI